MEDGNTYYVTRRVTVDDKNLESVTLNGEPVDMDVPFELVGDKNAVYTVVATDKSGNVTTYTVTMQPISAITDAVKDITKNNVTLGNKDALEKAEKALEKALDDFGGNYNDDERKTLNDRLDTVKAALDAIENAEKAAKKPTSPTTGDTSNLALWIALLFISGSIITGVTVAGKKKKQ